MPNYLICDLDECLVKSDCLYEQWFSLLKPNPLLFFISFFWLFKGKSHFKYKVAKHSHFDATLLPYRDDILKILKDFKREEKGEIILASASPEKWVLAVFHHLSIFNNMIASGQYKNIKGSNKLEAIKTMIGESKFTYIGDHHADLQVWRDATKVIAVNPSKYLRKKIEALKKPTLYVIDSPKKNRLRLLLKQIRPHQWVKNVLVFLPLLAAHKASDIHSISHSAIAFLGFSLSASFVYVLNDLLDLPSDRNHHTKKNRPFAAGDLTVTWGILLLPTLLLGVLATTSILPSSFGAWIGAYLILNFAYSFYFKQSIVIDVILLSMMYTIRIFAGSSATAVTVSEWLLSFSTMFFFSLACIKRYTEIIRSKNKLTIDGRGYRQIDHSMLQTLGAGAGLLSILIILMYLQSKDVRALYSHPEYLWFASPMLLFWISRVWILANRDLIHDDPVVFAVKDRVSWFCLTLISAILAAAI